MLLFIPFYKKMDKKPKKFYIAFIIAFAFEMHGIPFSMYVISWVVGKNLPNGILWGHTLYNSIGFWGMYINMICAVIALILIINGWYHIYQKYWSKDSGDGKVVKTGIYRYIRHPQYTGLVIVLWYDSGMGYTSDTDNVPGYDYPVCASCKTGGKGYAWRVWSGI